MRIGIIGGSFDPVHNQHLRIAMAALIECQLDEVWFVPVFQAVHKNHRSLLDYHHRRELLHAALRDYPQFRLSDIEQELAGPSYTVRTMTALKERYPEHEFFLIIGGDSLAELPTWREVERLVKLTDFIVVERPGYDRQSPLEDAVIHRVSCSLSEVSSTSIREKLSGHDFSSLDLDFAVIFLILQRDHYGCLGSNYHEWLKLVRKKQTDVPAGLQLHMLGVASLAVKYALEQGCDPRPLLVAGMAHDIFRCAPDAEIISLASSAGFTLRQLELETPMLAHGPAAAAWLLNCAAGIDSDVVAAVKDHTFPDENSSIVTRILATADTLEPSRGVPERDQLREADIPFEERYIKLLEIKNKAL